MSTVEDFLLIPNVKDVMPFLEQSGGTMQTIERPGKTFSMLIPAQ